MRVIQSVINLTTRGIVQDTTAPSNLGSGDDDPRSHTGGNVGVPGPSSTSLTRTKEVRGKKVKPAKLPTRETQRTDARATLLQRQCLKLGMSAFSRRGATVRSLGFTSAIEGEGKSFLACATASAIASQARRPLLLIDCNWEHPALHTLYDLPESPGLAEWVRGECSLTEVRQTVAPNLTVIPAGMALGGAVELIGRLAQLGVNSLLSETDEVLIADMPPVLTTAYATPLAQSLDTVTIVVRAGATWDSYVTEASHELENVTIEGFILNATQSHIPRWLQRIL